MIALLSQLRQATAQVHERMHEHPFMLATFGDAWSRPRYAHFLRAMAPPWRALEDALHAPASPLITQLAGLISPRHALICGDLTALGEPLPAAPSGSAALREGEVLGLAYTMVGSSMGARLLLKAVRERDALAPTRYFEGPGAPSDWPPLRHLLAAVQLPALDQELATARALLTFEDLEDALHAPIISPQPRSHHAFG